jgi:hypothetical protein
LPWGQRGHYFLTCQQPLANEALDLAQGHELLVVQLGNPCPHLGIVALELVAHFPRERGDDLRQRLGENFRQQLGELV